MDNEKLLKAAEVAERLGVNRATLFNWRTRNYGPLALDIADPESRKPMLRYRASEVMQFMGITADQS